MVATQLLLALLSGGSIAIPLVTIPIATRDVDPNITAIITAANIPRYVAPSLNRDITDWLAIGDSFSAGISADVPSDMMNYACSRFKMSYPNQMNLNPRLPGHSTSRTFVFGSCSGGKMQDVIDNQINLGTPDLNANYPKIGNPQIGTLSISGNDLGFGDDCTTLLKAAHTKLDDPGKVFELQIVDTIVKILVRARTANSGFQLYATGYVEFWNEVDTGCNTASWVPSYRQKVYLTTTLRADMNSLVRRLNAVIADAVNALGSNLGGIYYVDGWQAKYDGHRFCEPETDPDYHNKPIDPKTWFIHYQSPYKDLDSVTGLGNANSSFFDQVDSILIPPKNGVSTADQIQAVNGNLSALNPAYDSVDSMTAALTALAQNNATYTILPITWLRVMHPKGSGYTTMSDAVIDSVLQFGATGASAPGPVSNKACGFNNNKFMARDDMNNQINLFCADAAKQGVQDHNSGSTGRLYNAGTRYEVVLSMTWPSGLDITTNMEANCLNYMAQLMDGCDGNDPKNPLNWKHGGTFQVGQVQYDIIPQIDQGYAPGTCSFHLQEDESWTGIDGPGTERKWTYHIEKETMKDGAGVAIATLGFAKNGQNGIEIAAGDTDPLNFNTALPNPLVMTPEAAGNPRDYIQFNFGMQAWTTSKNTGMPYCKTGGWSSSYSPTNRNMDCFFSC